MPGFMATADEVLLPAGKWCSETGASFQADRHMASETTQRRDIVFTGSGGKGGGCAGLRWGNLGI